MVLIGRVMWRSSFFAAVCEKLGRPEQVLVYAAAAMDSDLRRAGTTLTTTRVIAQMFQGRALSAVGRIAEAGIVLDAAAAEAYHYKILTCK